MAEKNDLITNRKELLDNDGEKPEINKGQTQERYESGPAENQSQEQSKNDIQNPILETRNHEPDEREDETNANENCSDFSEVCEERNEVNSSELPVMPVDFLPVVNGKEECYDNALSMSIDIHKMKNTKKFFCSDVNSYHKTKLVANSKSEIDLDFLKQILKSLYKSDAIRNFSYEKSIMQQLKTFSFFKSFLCIPVYNVSELSGSDSESENENDSLSGLQGNNQDENQQSGEPENGAVNRYFDQLDSAINSYEVRQLTAAIEQADSNVHPSDAIGQAASNVHPSDAIVQAASNVHPSDTIGQAASNVHPSEAIGQAASNVHPSAAIRQAASNVHPSAAIRQAASNVHPSAAIRQAANNVHPSAAIRQAASNVQPSAAIRQAANNVHPSAAIRQAASNVHPSAAIRQAASNVNPSAAIRQAASNVQPSAAIRQAAINVHPSAAIRQAANNVHPSAAIRQAASNVHPSAAIRQAANNVHPSAAIRQAAIDVHPSAAENDLPNSADIIRNIVIDLSQVPESSQRILQENIIDLRQDPVPTQRIVQAMEDIRNVISSPTDDNINVQIMPDNVSINSEISSMSQHLLEEDAFCPGNTTTPTVEPVHCQPSDGGPSEMCIGSVPRLSAHNRPISRALSQNHYTFEGLPVLLQILSVNSLFYNTCTIDTPLMIIFYQMLTNRNLTQLFLNSIFGIFRTELPYMLSLFVRRDYDDVRRVWGEIIGHSERRNFYGSDASLMHPFRDLLLCQYRFYCSNLDCPINERRFDMPGMNLPCLAAGAYLDTTTFQQLIDDFTSQLEYPCNERLVQTISESREENARYTYVPCSGHLLVTRAVRDIPEQPPMIMINMGWLGIRGRNIRNLNGRVQIGAYRYCIGGLTFAANNHFTGRIVIPQEDMFSTLLFCNGQGIQVLDDNEEHPDYLDSLLSLIFLFRII
ncbi:uncharacterized protein [Mytilus edulis]|uniref:uncharacterized protein n=1 Tax=Mytilus edulis TaxID=6550 RepID=UPI0039EEB7A9